MKKNYSLNHSINSFADALICNLRKLSIALTIAGGLTPLAQAQQSYTFTNAGATGRLGPTQGQVTAAYLSNNLNGLVVSNSGVQNFTVPTSGMYRIEAYGASGGSVSVYSGYGAKVTGEVNLTAGAILQIIVGQMGTSYATGNSDGGGGGSFVSQAGTLLTAAGGGGGAAQLISTSQNASLSQTTTNNAPSVFGSQGAGFSSNGVHFTYGIYTTVGQSAVNGGNGQAGGQASGWPGGNYGEGGFGGGGSSCSCNTGGGGGGGGYVGGGGGGGSYQSGTGGASYVINTAVNTSASQLTTFGHGKVVITALCNITVANAVTGPICIGNSATLTTNAISNYVWSNGGNSSSIVVSPTVTTSYTLTATSPSNCTASAAITVTVNNTPTVTAVTSASVICLNKTVIFTASGANTYTWTGGPTNAVAFTPAATGSYTVTGTNACGISTAVVSVTVNPLPSITASINNPTVCSGSTIILIGGGSVGGYTWTAGAPNNSAFIPPVTNNYTVTGIGANNCTSTAVVGVTVLITPTITPVVTPTAICIGEVATLSGVGATGYTWTPGTNQNAATFTVSPPIPTTYTLVRTNGACTNTSTVTLVVNPLPLVAATASPSQICVGTGVNLVVLGPITNTWLPGGFTASNFTLFPNFSTNYTVTGSSGFCKATAIVSVVVNPTPTLSLQSSTTTVCAGNAVTLNGGGAITYTWLPSLNTNTTTEVVTPPTTTIITLGGTNSFGCTASIQQLIVVNPLPNMNLSSNVQFVCASQNAVLTFTNPSANVVYNWSTGATGTSIVANPSVTTTYGATGTNTITGCQNSNAFTLAVYISTFAVTTPTAICKGETAVMTASGQATSYSWTANGGTIAPSVSVAPVNNTTYYVTGTNGSCVSSQTIPIVVNPLPNVTAAVTKGQICRFEVSTITGNGATSYSWSTGASTPTISFTLSITTTYTLIGTDVNNCSKTTTVTQFVATCIGIEDSESKNNIGLDVYPNPNNGRFIVTSDVNIQLQIINTLGQLASTIEVTADNKKDVNVADLPNGIYFITGEANGTKINKKIIIEK